MFSALEAENGPIVVSASLLALVHQKKAYANISPRDLAQRYNEILERIEKLSFSDISLVIPVLEEERALKFSFIDFNAKKAEKWIIKEINPSLYLLLPKKYLQGKKINFENVVQFASHGPITQIEKDLGLKVNHMKTVTISNIKKLEPAPEYADYFIKALNSIFVINAEYPEKNKIPAWALYIDGHGLINHSITDLSFDQFKSLLAFLETKINTKVFVYNSCYAAATNSLLIYKDTERAIDKTYPFTIITMALTDAPTYTVFKLEIEVNGDILQPRFNHSFTEFLSRITSSEITKYNEAIASITTEGAQNIPQIKYPGLPWFSILDNRKVAIIDSIMAKTRTAPLDIATFFARKGTPAEPQALLLTASDNPFEIIINTKSNPTIVSMIPGDASHHIKKISSKNKTLQDILNSFDIKNLMPIKVFVIDEIEAQEDLYEETLQDVVIVLEEGVSKKYFTFKGKRYAVSGTVDEYYTSSEASNDDQKNYDDYLKRFAPTLKEKTIITLQFMSELQSKADKLFTQKMSALKSKNILQIC